MLLPNLARGRCCSPSRLFISSGDRHSWRFASACARCRRFCWRACASWWPGIVLYGWMRARGTPSPTAREWGAASFLAILIFVFDYGLLFWAEKRVPSGIAAVMMATIPVFMALAEIVFLRTQRLTLRLGLALAGWDGRRRRARRTLGEPGRGSGGSLRAPVPCSSRRSVGRWRRLSVASCRCPPSKAMSSGAQMLAGGVLLMLTAALLGEFRGFHVQAVSRDAWLALAYLIVAGSIVGFTAYVWLHSSRIADQGRHLRVCESGGRGAGGIFSGRRSDRPAHHRGDAAGAGERGGDHDHAEAKPVAKRPSSQKQSTQARLRP